MHVSVHAVLMIVALVLFMLAGFNVPSRVNFVALGLAAWVAAILFA